MSEPFHPAVNATFDKLTPEQWADMVQNGLQQYSRSVAHDMPPYDYSGFGLAEIFVANEIPAQGFAKSFERLSDQSKAALLNGLRLVAERLPAPPNEDTSRIIQDFSQLIRAVKAKEILPIFTARIGAEPAWRDDKDSYHALIQLAQGFNVSALDDAIVLARAVIGPEGARSSHFKDAHVSHPTLRPALTVDGAYVGRR